MEFTCEKKELQSGVQIVEKIVAARSTLPIIGNILFEITKTGLKLSSNNLEIGLELNVKAQVVKEGAFLLQAKTLSNLVSRLPEGPIKIRLAENGTVRVSYGSSHTHLNSLPPDEFPSLPKIKEGKVFNIKSSVLASMIKQTIFAVSSSEDKYVLTGILLETGKSPQTGDTSNLRMVATDGYRLAKRSETAKGVEGVNNVIVPARAFQELLRIIEGSKEEQEVKVQVSTEQISFRFGDVYLVSRLIQGQFPDYRQVIPKKGATRAIVNTKELLKAAERVAVIAAGSANLSLFEIRANQLHLSANTPDVGSVDEKVPVEVSGGEKAKVSFNIRLITDALEVISSEKTVIELGEGLSPGVIRPEKGEEYLYIVMPIRTQEAG